VKNGFDVRHCSVLFIVMNCRSRRQHSFIICINLLWQCVVTKYDHLQTNQIIQMCVCVCVLCVCVCVCVVCVCVCVWCVCVCVCGVCVCVGCVFVVCVCVCGVCVCVCVCVCVIYIKGKTVPLQAWTGPESSRRLRLPDFKTIRT
jgi:hypothetical protein